MQPHSSQINLSTHLYILFGLIAVELLMSFSFLGYVHTSTLSITFAFIPVMIAGCILKPTDSTILGIVFGLASMWKASASYVSADDKIFSPFLSGSPLSSLLLSVGSRALFGLIMGILYLLAKRADSHKIFWIVVVSLFGKNIHSVLVYGVMDILFPELGYGITNVFQEFLSWNNLLTILITSLLVFICWKICNSTFSQRYQQHEVITNSMNLTKRRNHFAFLTAVMILMLLFSGAVAYYFVNRMNYMLGAHGITLPEGTYYDMLHLQIQFLLGIFSLSFLIALIFIFSRKHAAYRNFEANTDVLTNLLNRRGFFHIFSNFLKNLDFSKNNTRYFIILDVDWFKNINDRYGHQTGDRVLHDIAVCIRDSFGEIGSVGRLGGDEFVIFIHDIITKEELETILRHFMHEVHSIYCEEEKISCSIGIVSFTEPKQESLLYQRADEALYAAKKQGRDKYLFGKQ